MNHKSRYKDKPVWWDHKPAAVQETIRQYLLTRMYCKVRGREGHEGVYITSKSSKTVQLFLSAIKGFYKTMIRLNMYSYDNPLIGLDESVDMKDYLGVRANRPRLSPFAGTEEPLSFRRETDSYFKIINDELIPEIIENWDLPYRVYQAGEASGWSLRDEVITRFMFETGARISEIIELTIGDYRNRTDIHELAAINKGSFKRRIK